MGERAVPEKKNFAHWSLGVHGDQAAWAACDSVPVCVKEVLLLAWTDGVSGAREPDGRLEGAARQHEVLALIGNERRVY